MKTFILIVTASIVFTATAATYSVNLKPGGVLPAMDGNALTNLNIPASGVEASDVIAIVETNNFSSLSATNFTGDGSGLTNLTLPSGLLTNGQDNVLIGGIYATNGAVSVGANTVSDISSLAVGVSNIVGGKYSIAQGIFNTNEGNGSISLGSGNYASAPWSLSLGAYSKATNTGSFVWSALTLPQSSESNGTFTVGATASRFLGGSIYGTGLVVDATNVISSAGSKLNGMAITNNVATVSSLWVTNTTTTNAVSVIITNGTITTSGTITVGTATISRSGSALLLPQTYVSSTLEPNASLNSGRTLGASGGNKWYGLYVGLIDASGDIKGSNIICTASFGGVTNSTAPGDAATIKAWINFTNTAGGVFKMPLYQ
jgi:hypothetical protein